MPEQIYAFTYKPSPIGRARVGSLWAKDVHEASRMAASALADKIPGHVKMKLFRASDPKYNTNMIPVPDPDGDGWLTPRQALDREQTRRRVNA